MLLQSVADEVTARRSGTSSKSRERKPETAPSKGDTAQTSFAICAVGATEAELDEELRRLRDLFS